MLVHVSVSELVVGGYSTYSWRTNSYETRLSTVTKDLLKDKYKDDTFLAVFSIGQEKQLEFFKENYPCNILFESKRSINTNHDPNEARNVLVVFELKDK